MVGDTVPTTTQDAVSGDCETSTRGGLTIPPGEICGTLPLSVVDQLDPGNDVSDPVVQLVTHAGDIRVELTVGGGDMHPPHEPADTFEEDNDDDNWTLSV